MLFRSSGKERGVGWKIEVGELEHWVEKWLQEAFGRRRREKPEDESLGRQSESDLNDEQVERSPKAEAGRRR